ncbi:MAG: Rpn family recombination-promoting nuclease/putative transposase [Chloroflexota bacterium]
MADTVYNIHDRGYTKLFSNLTIFKQLLFSFVEESWVDELDFNTAERINKSFISDSYKHRTSDILYKVKLRGKDIYLVILTEFQSSVDRFMALRVLHYITCFYMDYIETKRKEMDNRKDAGYLLPAIFPIVLYNGTEDWTAPVDIADLIQQHELLDLGEYKLNFKYFKISENTFSQEALLKMHNIVSTLFLAETNYDIDLLVQEMLGLFEHEEDKRAISLLFNWFMQLWKNDKISREDYDKLDEVYRSAEEVKTMLEATIVTYKQKLVNQGIEQGRIEGREEGRLMERRSMLVGTAGYIYKLSDDHKATLKEELNAIDSIEPLIELTNMCLDRTPFDEFRDRLNEMLAE